MVVAPIAVAATNCVGYISILGGAVIEHFFSPSSAVSVVVAAAKAYFFTNWHVAVAEASRLWWLRLLRWQRRTVSVV